MRIIKKNGVLTGLLVREAMRRQVIQLPGSATLARCINHLIKYKINGLMVTDGERSPVGVISKSDLVTAFYGGLPVESALADIMNGPLLTCFPDDELEVALDRMLSNVVQQLYVQGAESSSIIGILSYPDVVALLYRYCSVCPRNATRRSEQAENESFRSQSIREIMSASVAYCSREDPLEKVIEKLIAHRPGAVLIQDDQGLLCGVVSKTDVVVAYNHGTGLQAEARSIMQPRVVTCSEKSSLTEALRHMFLNDVQHLFIHAGEPSHIIGELSLADAARMRSGSCKACIASRIIASPRGAT